MHFSAASCALWGLFIYNIYNTPRRLNFVNKSPESTRMTAEKAHYTPQIDGENDAPPHPVAEAPSRPPPPESTCPATSRSVTKSVLLFVAGVVLKAAPCELFLMSSSLCIVSDVVLALHAPLRGPLSWLGVYLPRLSAARLQSLLELSCIRRSCVERSQPHALSSLQQQLEASFHQISLLISSGHSLARRANFVLWPSSVLHVHKPARHRTP